MSTLVDMAHYWGNDLSVSPTGDILTVSGLQRSQQRILRRLLTAQASYIAQPTYGAGIPQFIGKTTDPQTIAAITKAQMLLEDSVAASPPPVVTVSQSSSQSGAITESISYTDTPSNAPTVLAYTVSA